jgi:hypothetical protein
MIANATAGRPAHRRAGKILQVTRHRVLRWFRPPEAEVLRRRLASSSHPFPGTDEADAPAEKETPRAPHA